MYFFLRPAPARFIRSKSLPLAIFSIALWLAASLLFWGNAPATVNSFNSERLNFNQLPSGSIAIEDVTYQISSKNIQSIDNTSASTTTIATWPEGVYATRLNFLQTYQPDQGIEDWLIAAGLAHRQVEKLPDWPTVFNYELVYLDGKTVIIPVRFGESIREWRRAQTIAPMLWARSHWTKSLTTNAQTQVTLYSMQIPNPRPDIALTQIRALPSQDPWKSYGKAFILAVKPQQQPSSGKLYFVAPKPIGKDSQIGTLTEPFGTLQKALDVAKPGDTVLIRNGVYALDEPIVKKFNGEKNKWLTISAFPGETPIFDAFGIHYDYREKPYGDRPPSLGHFQQDTGAIHLWGDPDFSRVQGLQIQRSRRAAISVYGNKDQQKDNATSGLWGKTDRVEINFNKTYQTYSMGIISHGVNYLSVIGNQVIRPHSTQMAFDPQTGDPRARLSAPQEGIDLSRNRHFEIAFNVVAGGGKEAIDCIRVQSGSIHHNYIHSSLNGIYIDSWSVPISNLKIYRNFIENTFNGIPLSTEGSGDLLNIDIHHNIILNAKSNGISISEAVYKGGQHRPAKVANHQIYNNTIDGVGGHGTAIGWLNSGINLRGYPHNQNFRDILVQNNILTNTEGRPMSNSYANAAHNRSIRFFHNLIFPLNQDATPLWLRTSNKQWLAKDFEPGMKSVSADPLFINPAQGDFRLSPNSPAIGAGMKGEDLGAINFGEAWVPGLDFAGAITGFYRGATRWQAVDIATDKYTIYRNHLQRPSWFQEERYGADFQPLADGEQSLAGITFLIAPDTRATSPNVMALSGIQTESSADSIQDIAVNRKADRIAFLHNVHIADREKLSQTAPTIFNYRIHYEDNSYAMIPVRLGHEIEAWSNHKIQTVDNAKIAWLLPYLPHRRRSQSWLHLYAFEWQNSRPNLAITKIDILRAIDKKLATPAVFAISTGMDNKTLKD
ncbi:MAG: hypothetical protein GC158_03285 [Cyanobacteria bacterium RI_101]|nr:hypothetical protein [Cyanobacteria bacterium RI_101]